MSFGEDGISAGGFHVPVLVVSGKKCPVPLGRSGTPGPIARRVVPLRPVPADFLRTTPSLLSRPDQVCQKPGPGTGFPGNCRTDDGTFPRAYKKIGAGGYPGRFRRGWGIREGRRRSDGPSDPTGLNESAWPRCPKPSSLRRRFPSPRQSSWRGSRNRSRRRPKRRSSGRRDGKPWGPDR